MKDIVRLLTTAWLTDKEQGNRAPFLTKLKEIGSLIIGCLDNPDTHRHIIERLKGISTSQWTWTTNPTTIALQMMCKFAIKICNAITEEPPSPPSSSPPPEAQGGGGGEGGGACFDAILERTIHSITSKLTSNQTEKLQTLLKARAISAGGLMIRPLLATLLETKETSSRDTALIFARALQHYTTVNAEEIEIIEGGKTFNPSFSLSIHTLEDPETATKWIVEALLTGLVNDYAGFIRENTSLFTSNIDAEAASTFHEQLYDHPSTNLISLLTREDVDVGLGLSLEEAEELVLAIIRICKTLLEAERGTLHGPEITEWELGREERITAKLEII